MRVRGFSYIEIIFTVAILAVIASALLPYVELSVTRKKEAELSHNLREIRNAIDEYKQAVDNGIISSTIDKSGYPPELDILVEGVPNARDPKQGLIYFLRRMPRDPMNSDTTIPAEQTWGKRSYGSPPDAPQEGEDVFDVYSLSNQVGLNGIPYNEW